MAQPNFQILSDAAAASAQQFSLMPNLPVVDFGAQLLQIQQSLQEIQEMMRQQGQQLVQQGQELVRQGQQVVQQREELVQIRQDILRSERNTFSRLLNSSVNRSDTRLEVLYDLNNQPVQGFPETGADIGVLTGPELNALLGQLDLPIDGNVGDRKRRFINYIGLLSNLI